MHREIRANHRGRFCRGCGLLLDRSNGALAGPLTGLLASRSKRRCSDVCCQLVRGTKLSAALGARAGFPQHELECRRVAGAAAGCWRSGAS